MKEFAVYERALGKYQNVSCIIFINIRGKRRARGRLKEQEYCEGVKGGQKLRERDESKNSSKKEVKKVSE